MESDFFGQNISSWMKPFKLDNFSNYNLESTIADVLQQSKKNRLLDKNFHPVEIQPY